MYSPEAISRDISSNLMYSSNNSGLKPGLIDGVLFKSKEILGPTSDLYQNDHHQQQQQSGGGALLRYRSAPSSYFSSYLDGSRSSSTNNNNNNNNNNNHSTNNSHGDSSESESMFSALLNRNNEPKKHVGLGVSSGPSPKIKISCEVESSPHQSGNGFCGGVGGLIPMGGYGAAVSAGGGTVVGSYNLGPGGGGGGVENHVQARSGMNLVRQSSSPAGFFSGFDMMQEVANFRGGTNGEASSSTSGLNNGMNFTSGPASTSRFMPIIAENGNESVANENGQLEIGNDNARAYASRFSRESWDDTPFNSLKRNREDNLKMFSNFSGLENQGIIENRNHSSGLTHHLSLPKTAVEMAAVEKYLQFQPDSIPCKIRAKRGCATHPRSIAERMRRTRISERMKKLQELFPNMDKQTNTADMLDWAVEHIKTLQKQVQTLTETRAKCTCSSKQQRISHPSA